MRRKSPTRLAVSAPPLGGGRVGRLAAALVLALMAGAPNWSAAQSCIGDCNADTEIALGEVQRGFNIFLGSVRLDTCPSFDADEDGEVALGEVQVSFTQFLGSCSTPIPGQGTTYFVRATSGDDRNGGKSAASALRTINAALAKVAAGDEVIVGPGVYEESVVVTQVGTAARPITLSADPLGRATGDPAGGVVIDANAGMTPGIRISGAAFLTVDGFSVRGGAIAGVQIRGRQMVGSHDVTIRHCQIFDGQGAADGVLIQDSADILLFDNLIFRNPRRGVVVVGSPRTRLVNNTIANNQNRGIFVVQRDGVASKDLFLRNNISQDNAGANLQVDPNAPSSIDGFDSETNLIFPDSYQPSDLPRPSDISADALFVRPLAQNFLLSQAAAGQEETSPAVDAGVEENMAGGPQADFASLRRRATATSGALDEGPLDLGFHAVPSLLPPESVNWYVRIFGSDANSGTTPLRALASIGEAALRVEPGDRIVVGPGVYFEHVDAVPSGIEGKPILFAADPSGAETGDPPSPVVVDARRRPASFRLSAVEHVVIDGFVLAGGAEAGATVRDSSSHVTIRHCEVRDNEIGVFVQNSSDVLVFDNWVTGNDSAGILVGGITGSDLVRLINNTVVANAEGGISIGTSDSAPPADTLLQNNVVQDNGGDNVRALAASAETVAVRHNLVSPPAYSPPSLRHESDVNEDAAFVAAGDAHLSGESPALNAADPETDPDLAASLGKRSTRADGEPDGGRIDLGYHFPIFPDSE